ncbi:MutS-related protein [Actinoplanes sp. CA-131856]
MLLFFASLRTEMAFYVGCLALRRALTERGAPVCRPVVRDAAERSFSARGLYDPGLQLRLGEPVAANDVDADGTSLIMITGANRGGKSTFLRGVGLAQLLATAGAFVPATAFTTTARSGVFTHFTTDEDDALTSGKFDEELRRMSRVADVIAPHGLLLCNESFQSTNEREGSDIARRVIDAMTGAGVTVVFVTHLNELAQGCYRDRDRYPALFLRAGRDRSFRLREAEPEATSHGADLWNRVRKP